MHHRTYCLLIILFLSMNLYSSSGTDSLYLNSYKVPNYSKKEINAAKHLEDYQWSLRKGKIKRALKNYRYLKRGNTSLYRRYRGLLHKGISKKSTSCSLNRSSDPISSRLQTLIYKKCLANEINQFLNSKYLSAKNTKTLEAHFENLLGHKYRSRFLKKITKMSARSRIKISTLLKSYIKRTKSLPPREFLQFMIIDHKITQFIQERKLFEQKEISLYSKEFKLLVNKFKEQFINGEESQAKEALERAIVFYENNRTIIDPDKAWMLFIISGKKLARKHEYNLAIDMFKLSEKIANEENQYESKFQTLFALYRDQQLGKAREFISKQGLIKNYSKIGSKLRFWIANIYDQSKEYKRAKELYLKQISSSPLNYYSIISLRKLRRLAPHYDTNLLVSASQENQFPPELSRTSKEYLKLYGLFLRSNSHSLAELMAVSLRRMPSTSFFSFDSNEVLKKSESLKSYFLITYFSRKGEHLHSFKEAYSKLNKGKLELNSQVVNALFPDEFSKLVKKSTGPLDHRFVLSLIRQESAFNKKAKSIVGARGLMQIMPRTGQQFVRNLKANHLYRPSLNVRIGSKFLRTLLKRFEGNFIFALAAYNAGLGNVSRWLRTIPFSADMLANIEMIPFKETRNYVKLIYRNYFFYRYKEGNTESLDIPTNQTFNIAFVD